MPKVKPRRPYYDHRPDGPLESLNDWMKNNVDVVEWFLENAEEIRLIISKNSDKVSPMKLELTESELSDVIAALDLAAIESHFGNERYEKLANSLQNKLVESKKIDNKHYAEQFLLPNITLQKKV